MELLMHIDPPVSATDSRNFVPAKLEGLADSLTSDRAAVNADQQAASDKSQGIRVPARRSLPLEAVCKGAFPRARVFLLALSVSAFYSLSSTNCGAANPATQAPIFPVASGAYHTIQTITMVDANAQASIYYTTNGTTPTSQSTLYTGPITLNASESFSAVAVAPGGSTSPVAKAWYTIDLPAAAPVATPGAGTYTAGQTVTLSDSTPNATIYYSTNGIYPTTSSPTYGGPITISSNTTLQAWAIAPNFEGGAVMSASYTIVAAAPSISPAPGTYAGAQTVTLNSPTPGATIRYTTNGTTPNAWSTTYSGPFSVSTSETVRAMTFASNYGASNLASASYTILMPAAAPTFSPKAGTFVNAQRVTLGCSTANAVIYYTTDGSSPTTQSAVYSGPINVSGNETISAFATATGSTSSTVSQATYTITPPAAAPVFSLASGTFNSPQTIAISDATPAASIYYTTNGTAPTSQSTLYTGPISVSAPTNFQAAGLAPGGSLSPTTKAWYDIILPTTPPVASPGAGTYNAIQLVALTDATPGATIYYTLNGSYPTAASAVYTGPITVTANTQITALATAPGYSVGSPLTAVYSIVAPPPVITPQSGTLQNTARVTIADAAPGAVIYYTSDGSIPSTASPVYSGPIALSPAQTTTEVYQAIAVAPGYLQSANSVATFTIDLPAGTLAQAQVGSGPARAIPQNFLGLSMNWAQPPLVMGQASTGVNYVYRTLLNNLLANTSAPLLIRVTGDGSQLSDIQADIEPMVEFAKAVNVNYAPGVDLWYSNLPLAEAEASAWARGLPPNSIQAIEIGNEPDVYPYNGARTPTYNFSQYLAQYQQWQQGVNTVIGNGIGTMGPSMGQQTNWVANTESAVGSNAMGPAIVSQHAYVGGQNQDGNTVGGAPWPLDELLQPAATTTYPTLFAPLAAAAHKAGRLFRMGEVNSFWGGITGISNTFQSSLWSIDLMFNYVNNGMDGVNWNDEYGVSYELSVYGTPTTSNGQTVYNLKQVNPLYYGLLVFSQMAGHNAQLLPVTTSTNANVSIWATLDNTPTTHVVVINKDEHATGTVQLAVPGYTTGTLRYLVGANYAATNGITLGGQTFDGSPDGTIQGQLVATPITATNGVFVIPNMPIVSAAILSFPQ